MCDSLKLRVPLENEGERERVSALYWKMEPPNGSSAAAAAAAAAVVVVVVVVVAPAPSGEAVRR